jgi:1-acyl-sn-glycerol-3-phosphate acyltransferase
MTAIPLFLTVENWGHAVHRVWCQGWCAIMGLHITLEGVEKIPDDTAVIFAPNHESFFDILVMGTCPVRYKWVSKEQVGRIPILGWGMKAMGTYFVKRDHSGHDLNVMHNVEEGLRHGKSIIMFPEGTRTRTGELLPFKKGAFRTAQNAGVPLVPIAISGTRSIAPPGSLPTGRGHQVTVRFGEPLRVPPGDISGPMEEFRRILVSLLEENRLKKI